MTRAALLLLLLPLVACAPPPKAGDFNTHVAAIMDTYPTDGTHGYYWPKTGTWIGTTRTLRYAGEVLAEGDPKGRCHCCGLTFEVFLRAWERHCKATSKPYRILDWKIDKVRAFRKQWFGTSGDRATLHTAITENGLGRRVTDLEKAKAGDFIQLWRESGSGHSCIFKAWVRDEEGKITALRYWSTQKSTNGIGERTEKLSALKLDELYIVRVGGT